MKYSIIALVFILIACLPVSGQSVEGLSPENSSGVVNADTNKINVLNNKSEQLWKSGLFDSAIVYANHALVRAKELQFKKGIADAFHNLGVIYKNKGSYLQALQNDLDALNIYREIGDKNGTAAMLGNIGNLYMSRNSIAQALEYDFKALAMCRELGDKIGIARNLGNIGIAYADTTNYGEALKYTLNSLQLHQEIGDKQGIAANFSSIASIYYNQKKLPIALEYYRKALAKAREIGGEAQVAREMGNIGGIFLDQEKYKVAKIYLDSALNLEKAIGSNEDMRGIYSSLTALDSDIGDYKTAFRDYEKSITYHDIVINDANTKKMEEAQMTFDFKSKTDSTKAAQNKLNIIAEQEKKRQVLIRNVYLGGFVLISVVLFLLYARYRSKEKTSKVLGEQNRIINERNIELERLSIVAKETENVILIMDAAGKVEWANESFSRINDITIEELKKQKGETIYEISNNPDIRKIINTAVNEKRSMVYESVNLNKQGGKIWESSTLTPIFDTAGKLKKIIIIDTDITRAKNDEEIIRQKNKDMTDSINYAEHLQEAILPPVSLIKKVFPKSFVLYKPKDIVSGDFYWMENAGDFVLIAAADCTGHGVPGALVSVVCSNALNRAVKEFHIIEPGKILDKARELILETFAKSERNVQDGMDISLCCMNTKTNELLWSGAYNPLWYVQEGKMHEIQADKQPIGKHDNPKPFNTHQVNLGKGDILYLFTDGYADQFGGPEGKKFKYKRLEEKIMEITALPLPEQQKRLESILDDWKGRLEQVDDILVIGIRV